MHRHNIRVYYEDTDAGGIVYYANYLKFLERARTEWLRELGVEQDRLLEQSTGFVVKHLEINYQAAARFNEMLVVESQLATCKRVSLVFDQSIYNHKNRPLVTARVKVGCVNLSNMRPMAIPDFVLGELSGVR